MGAPGSSSDSLQLRPFSEWEKERILLPKRAISLGAVLYCLQLRIPKNSTDERADDWQENGYKCTQVHTSMLNEM